MSADQTQIKEKTVIKYCTDTNIRKTAKHSTKRKKQAAYRSCGKMSQVELKTKLMYVTSYLSSEIQLFAMYGLGEEWDNGNCIKILKIKNLQKSMTIFNVTL